MPKTDKKQKTRLNWRLILIIVLILVLIYALVSLAFYGYEYFSKKKTSDEFSEIYQAETTVSPQITVSSTEEMSAPTVEPTVTATASPAPAQETKVLRATREPSLPKIWYPANPYAEVVSRFEKLKSRYPDTAGWLTIQGLLDQAVMLRDNEFYMTHDESGHKNSNGAFFLDSSTDLSTRPYTLIIYGHNMKSGAMFGSLRNYLKKDFYQKNAFFTFDSIYENGRYVIFSVCEASTNHSSEMYLDFVGLDSAQPEIRRPQIEKLRALSVYDIPISVQADDQILLLVTCVDAEDDRRIVAARRVRKGESEEILMGQVAQTVLK